MRTRPLRRAVDVLVECVSATPETLGEALVQVALVAATWPRLKSHERRKVRTAAERLAGLVDRRTDRLTGQRIGVYSAESGLVDLDCAADGERYAVVCEEHASIVHVRSQREARAVTSLDFCDDCREEAAS